ncbi:MAG: hypothetical protein OXG04_22120 [Acidobacteria bacterium]|nr:hypothetical protein [Acidobacteriota bacterium]
MTQFPTRHRRSGDRGGLTRKAFLEAVGAAAAAALWPAARPRAQEAPSRDARERIARVVREYDSQGDHRTGSPVDAESGRWLADRVDEAGLVPEIEWMGFSRIGVQAAYLEVGDRWAEGVPLFDGGFTDAAGVSGTLSSLDGDGTIGLGHVGPRAGADFRAHRRATPQQAVVTVTGGPSNDVPDGLALINAPDFKAPFGPPVLQVASRHRTWLTAAAASGATARVVAHVTRRPEEVFNVTATLRGREPSLAPVFVMTPRSGWWTCASERGGGIAVWIEMIRGMAAAPLPRRTTVFLASTGHELGHYGLAEFLRTRSRLVRSAAAWIHLGANFGAAVGGEPLLQASTAELQSRAQDALRQVGGGPARRRPAGEEPNGEARHIHAGGGTYLSVIGANGLFHHPADRWPDAVDVDRIARYARAFTDVGLQLANA